MEKNYIFKNIILKLLASHYVKKVVKKLVIK